MRSDGAAIQTFLAQDRLALVGVSRDPKDFSRQVMRELVAKGYDVVPLNPAGGEVEGRRVFTRLQEVTPPVGGAIVMTPAAASAGVVRDCVEAGVRRVWLHRGAGVGAVSDEAVQAARGAGLELVAGECPLMFAHHPALVHRVHGAVRRAQGEHPLPAPPAPGAQRWGLVALQVFVALGALPVGWDMIRHPASPEAGLPVSLLEHSPFADFFVPGLVLFTVNGLGNLLGAALGATGSPRAGWVGAALGAFLMAWIALQVLWIGPISALQPALFAVGLAELILGAKLALR